MNEVKIFTASEHELRTLIRNELSGVIQAVFDKLPEKDETPISEKQACEMLGKSRQTLSRYRKIGKFRYHRIGREIYYFPHELREDLKNL